MVGEPDESATDSWDRMETSEMRKIVAHASGSLIFGWLTVVTSAAAEPVDYLRDIKPLLHERCFACHGALQQKSQLRLDTGTRIQQGGEGGPAVVAGKPDSSPLIERITAKDDAVRMPPEGKPLTPEQIRLIRAWIEQGAVAPADEQPEVDPREHWSFQPPVRRLPPMTTAVAMTNPIDAFLAVGHQQHQLTARPPVDKSLLLRRVTLDLIGVPPTRDELHAFLADDSTTAYETVVNRLLKDPRHGERWARHWMDIWRYSDWYGRRRVPDPWNSAPQIWRWRDWIVQSLNADHGYDRMVREMLAADEFCPEDDSATVATGYLIRNWYALNPNDWMRNTVEHTGKAFLGLTFNCAHCHDHKYDPITQDDYFRLRAFFEPIDVRQDRIPGEADPGPFQEYQYGVLRKVQRLGAVRVYDKNPQAPTWFYTGGDERNRVKERGSLAPGVPAFLTGWLPAIEPRQHPAGFWYPGSRPDLQETVLNDGRRAISTGETELASVRKTVDETLPALQAKVAEAQSAFDTARDAAVAAGTPGALAGRQSLLLDASSGRRILHQSLQQLKSLDDGTTIRFQWRLLTDTHVNFQFAKDVVKGLTAGCVIFEKGRIASYQPGSFTEFEVGRYNFAEGQKQFEVTFVLQTAADRCLLTVRALPDGPVLADAVPVALNGWNPVGDATKAITFDARAGSVVAIDDVAVFAPVLAGATDTTPPVKVVFYDFESPAFTDGHDVVGLEGWTNSPGSEAPATSLISTTSTNESLRELSHKLQLARQAAALPEGQLHAAEIKLAAARAELRSIEARIAADRARYSVPPAADATADAQAANRCEREAAVAKFEAALATSEHALALAESKPASDGARTKAVETANKQRHDARAALDKARTTLADTTPMEAYAPLSPQYPLASTGRRRALAEWITNRHNPLTARVAVNHVWAWHFHAPLVATVSDFGRSGAKPTHPELLDWLAVEFMDSGWSLQHLHRLMVTSAAYQRSSSGGNDAASIAIDPDNHFLWRMNAGRMEAEVVRDSLLFAAGKLDLTVGGQELENTEALTNFRRSLYFSCYPEEGGKSAFGELFDGPNPADCYRRARSVIPQQALALTNSELVHQLSSTLTDSLWKSAETAPAAGMDSTTDRFLEAAFEQILTRHPTAAEQATCAEFLARTEGTTAAAVRESLVRALLNHNDFVTIR